MRSLLEFSLFIFSESSSESDFWVFIQSALGLTIPKLRAGSRQHCGWKVLIVRHSWALTSEPPFCHDINPTSPPFLLFSIGHHSKYSPQGPVAPGSPLLAWVPHPALTSLVGVEDQPGASLYLKVHVVRFVLLCGSDALQALLSFLGDPHLNSRLLDAPTIMGRACQETDVVVSALCC